MRFAILGTLAAGCVLAALPNDARADPCEAIPERGPMPMHLRSGKVFSGPVTYVGDGDSLCIALGGEPSEWVEVRLADFYAPELSSPQGLQAKRALEHAALGHPATCVADHRSYDRVVARCTIAGVTISERLRAAGAREGGNGLAHKGAHVRSPRAGP